MSQAKQSLDLSALEQDYDIVGEVTGQGDTRTYAATRKIAEGGKRRDDSTNVLISIVTRPEGDEGNALSHLAADAKLLAGTAHRRLIPIVEGRWLGDDTFALVTERTADATLAQRLETGERFSTTRTAAILRELSGLLEWAREHNIVHRAITGNRIFLEQKTDRVRVIFGVAAIPRIQRTDSVTEDARTIVKLAMAMLTGRENPEEYGGRSLAEMRPDLPSQLRDDTAEMLDESKPRTAADVSKYISLIGMADPLQEGEHEASRIRAETLSEQLEEREKLFNERVEFDRMMKEERTTFDTHMAYERANFARLMEEERAKFAQEMADEREKHAKQKAELQQAVTAERAALMAQRASLERTVADQRKEIDRAAAEDRRQIEALRTELKRAGELEIEKKRDIALTELTDDESTLDRDEFIAPVFVPPVLGPLDELTFNNDSALMQPDEVEEAIEEVETAKEEQPSRALMVATTKPTVPPGRDVVDGSEEGGRKKWVIPAALAAAVVFIAASAVALRSNRGDDRAPAAAATPARQVASQPAAPSMPASLVPLPPRAPVVDSVGGVLASGVLLNDGGSSNEFGRPSTPLVRPRPRPRPRPVVRDTAIVTDTATTSDGLPIFRDASPARRDTPVPRRDTIVRRDSIIRPDTIPR